MSIMDDYLHAADFYGPKLREYRALLDENRLTAEELRMEDRDLARERLIDIGFAYGDASRLLIAIRNGERDRDRRGGGGGRDNGGRRGSGGGGSYGANCGGSGDDFDRPFDVGAGRGAGRGGGGVGDLDRTFRRGVGRGVGRGGGVERPFHRGVVPGVGRGDGGGRLAPYGGDAYERDRPGSRRGSNEMLYRSDTRRRSNGSAYGRDVDDPVDARARGGGEYFARAGRPLTSDVLDQGRQGRPLARDFSPGNDTSTFGRDDQSDSVGLDNLGDYLEQLSMQQYSSVLWRNGINTLEALERTTIEDLERLNILKGHAIFLKRAMYLYVNTDSVSHGDSDSDSDLDTEERRPLDNALRHAFVFAERQHNDQGKILSMKAYDKGLGANKVVENQRSQASDNGSDNKFMQGTGYSLMKLVNWSCSWWYHSSKPGQSGPEFALPFFKLSMNHKLDLQLDTKSQRWLDKSSTHQFSDIDVFCMAHIHTRIVFDGHDTPELLVTQINIRHAWTKANRLGRDFVEDLFKTFDWNYYQEPSKNLPEYLDLLLGHCKIKKLLRRMPKRANILSFFSDSEDGPVVSDSGKKVLLDEIKYRKDDTSVNTDLDAVLQIVKDKLTLSAEWDQIDFRTAESNMKFTPGEDSIYTIRPVRRQLPGSDKTCLASDLRNQVPQHVANIARILTRGAPEGKDDDFANWEASVLREVDRISKEISDELKQSEPVLTSISDDEWDSIFVSYKEAYNVQLEKLKDRKEKSIKYCLDNNKTPPAKITEEPMQDSDKPTVLEQLKSLRATNFKKYYDTWKERHRDPVSKYTITKELRRRAITDKESQMYEVLRLPDIDVEKDTGTETSKYVREYIRAKQQREMYERSADIARREEQRLSQYLSVKKYVELEQERQTKWEELTEEPKFWQEEQNTKDVCKSMADIICPGDPKDLGIRKAREEILIADRGLTRLKKGDANYVGRLKVRTQNLEEALAGAKLAKALVNIVSREDYQQQCNLKQVLYEQATGTAAKVALQKIRNTVERQKHYAQSDEMELEVRNAIQHPNADIDMQAAGKAYKQLWDERKLSVRLPASYGVGVYEKSYDIGTIELDSEFGASKQETEDVTKIIAKRENEAKKDAKNAKNKNNKQKGKKSKN